MKTNLRIPFRDEFLLFNKFEKYLASDTNSDFSFLIINAHDTCRNLKLMQITYTDVANEEILTRVKRRYFAEYVFYY